LTIDPSAFSSANLNATNTLTLQSGGTLTLPATLSTINLIPHVIPLGGSITVIAKNLQSGTGAASNYNFTANGGTDGAGGTIIINVGSVQGKPGIFAGTAPGQFQLSANGNGLGSGGNLTVQSTGP